MPTPIPPPNSHNISLATFLEMKKNYADNKNSILVPAYQGDEYLCISELFNVEATNELAAWPDCAAIRIYYGMDADLKVHAMLVAVNSNGDDMLPSAQTANFAPNQLLDGPPIKEDAQRCPPNCP